MQTLLAEVALARSVPGLRPERVCDPDHPMRPLRVGQRRALDELGPAVLSYSPGALAPIKKG